MYEMRRIATALVALFVISLTALAGNPIKVVKGNTKFFKTATGTATIDVDFKGATFDDKMPLSEKYDDLEEKVDVSNEAFIATFQHSLRKKKLKFTEEEEEADYNIVFKVTKIDEFIQIIDVMPGPAIRVWGTMTVTDTKSGEELLVIEVDNYTSSTEVTTTNCFKGAFSMLGLFLASPNNMAFRAFSIII